MDAFSKSYSLANFPGLKKCKGNNFKYPGLLSVCFLFSLFFSLICFSQDTSNSAEVENKSYQLYLEKNWDSLIILGKKALNDNIDYYYLRMRIGIAYYEKKEYRAAQKHFWKAISFNNNHDDLVFEFLYFSYIFSGQFDEAKKLSKKFSVSLSKKLNLVNPSTLNFIFAEGGTKKSSRDDLFSAPRYIQFGFGHQLGKSMSITHAFSNFLQPLQGQPPGIFNQNQYYLKSNIVIGKSWVLSPAVHFLYRKFTPNKPPQNGQQPQRPPQVQTSNSKVYSLSLKKSFSYFDAKCSLSAYKEMTGNPSIQESGTITIFPLANNRFSVSATGFMIQDKKLKKNFSASSYSLSFQPFQKISFTGNYLLNQSLNLNEENGYIVNNSYDLTTSRISGTLDFYVGNNVTLYLLLMKENKTETQKKINYLYNSAIIGIKVIP